jgi:hypothetical protein
MVLIATSPWQRPIRSCRLQVVREEPCGWSDGDEGDRHHKSGSCHRTDLPEKLNKCHHRPEDGGERAQKPPIPEEERQDDAGEEEEQAEAASQRAPRYQSQRAPPGKPGHAEKNEGVDQDCHSRCNEGLEGLLLA